MITLKDRFYGLSVTSKIVVSIFCVLLVFMTIAAAALSEFTRRETTSTYLNSVMNLALSLEKGAMSSLERGQMTNFKKLVDKQKEISGVVEVALYDRNGLLNVSSLGKEADGKRLADDLFKRIAAAKDIVQVRTEETIQIFAPQIVRADCIRCHPTWAVNEIGGVLSLTSDAGPLNETIRNRWILLWVGSLLLLLAIAGLLFLVIRLLVIKPINSIIDDLAKTTAEVAVHREKKAGDSPDDQSLLPATEKQAALSIGGDEIGKMRAAVDMFKENAMARYRLESECKLVKQKVAGEKRELMNKMADDFEKSVGSVIKAVTVVSDKMQSLAQVMSAIAEQTNIQSTTAVVSSDQASSNVQNVASAVDALMSSVEEIGSLVTQSTRIARDAVKKAVDTNEMVRSLEQASHKIGEIVEFITGIASNTHLLALNAHIEAARAGEFGRGFAVVANEVKTLARQTASATDEIRDQISGVQNATGEAVAVIQVIADIISEIDRISASIAAAVEEQGAATREIAFNTQEAATETKEVSANISYVAEAASETGKAAANVLETTSELTKQARILQEEVGKFLAHVRSI